MVFFINRAYFLPFQSTFTVITKILLTILNFFFLVTDNIGNEFNSDSIIKSWIQQQNPTASITTQLNPSLISIPKSTETDQYTILQPLSKQILKFKIEEIIQQIKSYQENQKIKQLFLWITIKNIQHPFIVKFMEHLANTVVHFENCDSVSILNKKSSGSISKKVFEKLIYFLDTFDSFAPFFFVAICRKAKQQWISIGSNRSSKI